LLQLVRAYCDFYEVAPDDDDLLAVSRALIADPEREGVQLLARADGDAVGFATVYWSWNTLAAARLGIMHDLFVTPEARGTGVADELIRACLEECRTHGAAELAWQTARDNARAQRVYDRLGATRSEWLDYSLSVRP
jgi:GNAT superfamily N-acetyltransferase